MGQNATEYYFCVCFSERDCRLNLFAIIKFITAKEWSNLPVDDGPILWPKKQILYTDRDSNLQEQNDWRNRKTKIRSSSRLITDPFSNQPGYCLAVYRELESRLLQLFEKLNHHAIMFYRTFWQMHKMLTMKIMMAVHLVCNFFGADTVRGNKSA